MVLNMMMVSQLWLIARLVLLVVGDGPFCTGCRVGLPQKYLHQLHNLSLSVSDVQHSVTHYLVTLHTAHLTLTCDTDLNSL